MKPLLSKTTRPFLIYVLIILIISIPVYYLVVDAIWKSELDEHNKTIAEKTAYEFNHLKLSDKELENRIRLWNFIQPETNIIKVTADSLKEDLFFTVEKQKTFSAEPELERYRCLKKIVYINNIPFLFTIQTNIEESEETIGMIAIVTVFFFIVIVVGLLYLNRRLSKTIWEPFRRTLEKLKTFNLNHQNIIEFEKTNTVEFEELHASLNKLIEHSVSVYQTQKEFTENASHELQTPLAIIKHKLDILLQDEHLTEKQYRITEDIHKALSRSSRINKDLLLLAKIDNQQFDGSENIELSLLVTQSIGMFDEHFQQKNIKLTTDIFPAINVHGNSSLTEVLINNLLINAIRHTESGGTVSVRLTDLYFQISNSGAEGLNQDLLFKRFSRMFSDYKGSGLGLAIIHEICKFQHWEISYKFVNHHHIFSIEF